MHQCAKAVEEKDFSDLQYQILRNSGFSQYLRIYHILNELREQEEREAKILS